MELVAGASADREGDHVGIEDPHTDSGSIVLSVRVQTCAYCKRIHP